MNIQQDIDALPQKLRSVSLRAEGVGRLEPSRVLTISIVSTAATLSIAATVSLFGNDVRVILSDAFVLISILVALYIGLLRHRDWLRTTAMRFALWSAIPVLVLTSALIQGIYTYDQLIPWAVVNRYVGMLVLMGYVFVGYLAGSFGSDFTRRNVVNPFLIVLCATGFVALVAHVMVGFAMPEGHQSIRFVFAWQSDAGWLTGWALDHFHRIQGLMQNPNAFGLLLIPALILVHEPRDAASRHWAFARYAVLAALVVMLAFTSSRSAWIAGAAAIILVGFLRREYGGAVMRLGAVVICASIFRIAVMGGIELWAEPGTVTLSAQAQEIAVQGRGVSALNRAADGQVKEVVGGQRLETVLEKLVRYVSYVRSESVAHRGVLVVRALELWRGAPLFGVGLGGYLKSGQPPGDSYGFTPHSDYMWLLSETGVVRLLLILSLCGFAFWRFWRRHMDTPLASGPIMGITALAAIMVAGLATDALYQRGLWLVLGIAAGLCARSNGRSGQQSL